MNILTQCDRVDDETPGAVASALQATPSLLASFDSQIVRGQPMSPAATVRDFRAPDFAAIDIREVVQPGNYCISPWNSTTSSGAIAAVPLVGARRCSLIFSIPVLGNHAILHTKHVESECFVLLPVPAGPCLPLIDDN